MQLNPARGRKLEHVSVELAHCRKVYAAQPREGTETASIECAHLEGIGGGFMQLNPARGRKLNPNIDGLGIHLL